MKKWGFYVASAAFPFSSGLWIILNVRNSCCLRGGLPARLSQQFLKVSRSNVDVSGISRPLTTLTPVWQQVGEAREQRHKSGPGSSFSEEVSSSSLENRTDKNEAHSCLGNCSSPHIISAPLPSPASCSSSHDSVYTLASYSRGHSRLHTRL